MARLLLGVRALEHEEFVKLHAQGLVNVVVDRSAAMDVCDKDKRIGKQKRLGHMLWSNLSILALFAGPISIIWFPWPIGISVFVLVGLGGMALARTAACSFVREAALEDSGFYGDLVKDGVMSVRRVGGSERG